MSHSCTFYDMLVRHESPGSYRPKLSSVPPQTTSWAENFPPILNALGVQDFKFYDGRPSLRSLLTLARALFGPLLWMVLGVKLCLVHANPPPFVEWSTLP